MKNADESKERIQNNYGDYIPPENIHSDYAKYMTPTYWKMKKNNVKGISGDYVRFINQEHKKHPNTNFGSVQIIGGQRNQNQKLPDSKIFNTRSHGREFRNEVDQNERTPIYGGHFFDSERTGLRAALDDYITERRANTGLPYNPYANHSLQNIRRPSSPSPLEYQTRRPRSNHGYYPQTNYDLNRLEDVPEIEALRRLSDQRNRYSSPGTTYGNVIKNWLNSEGSHINMLSERPACNHPGDLGCKQFLPQIMPKGSHYGYTSSNPTNVQNDRNILFQNYNTNLQNPPLQQNPLQQQMLPNRRTIF